MSNDEHPYKKFEGTENWEIVERAVNNLVSNGDLIEQTARTYIVGYICESLASSPDAAKSNPGKKQN